ncbi:glycosyltransferase [Vibrio vulnificus]|nr:glycosyltransferase family 1 protein [Vibrio vulnificus]
MKKVVIIHHFGGLGGAGKSLINNVKLLSSKCDLTVITPDEPADIRLKLYDIDNVKVSTLSFIPSMPIYSGGYCLLSPGLYFHIIKSLLALKTFITSVKSIDADVIVVNSIIMSWLSCFFSNKKKICFIRETKSRSLFNFVHKWLLNRFDLVCFISQFDRVSWSLKTDSIVNENSVDNDYIGEAISTKSKRDKVNFVFLGGTSYIKGFYHLCASILRMKSRSKLNIFVLGECRPFGMKLAESIFGTSSPFTFVGKVSDVGRYYQMSDAVIFPVVKVHQGRPIFEAGQHKRGAIVPDYSNFDEFVQHMINGIVYRKRCSKSLSKVLSLACDGSIDFKLLGEENYRAFECKHSLKSAQHRSEIILQKIV